MYAPTPSRFPPSHVPPALWPLMDALAGASIALARRIARNGVDEHLGALAGTNADGDSQKALDVIADGLFLAAARAGGVAHYASEEQEAVIELGKGALALAIDPLDGSSNIDTNVSVGTIFSIHPAAADPEASFLRPVVEQIGAGYVIYGPQVGMVCSFGAGVQRYVLDPEAGTFVLADAAVRLPDEAAEFAINASNYRHWQAPVRAFVDECLAGTEGPRGKNFNMRWIASLVAEAHRIFVRGGVFLYPADGRKGYEAGRLRLLYECAPMAFLAVQAGGRATDGRGNILAMSVHSLHQRVPFVFGSRDKVQRVADHFAGRFLGKGG